MKIRYGNTVEDLVVFNPYHTAHSPALRLQRVGITIAALVLPAAVLVPVVGGIVSAAREEGDPIGLAAAAVVLLAVIAIGAVVSAICVWAARRLFARLMDWQVRRLMKEGENK